MAGWLCFLLLLMPARRAAAEQPRARSTEGQAHVASPASEAEGILARQVQPKVGETCLVCNQPISSDGAVYLVDGQRVPVHRGACDDKLRTNPRIFLAKLKPRGAFLDAGSLSSKASYGWLYVGFYVLAGLVFGALAAHRAFRVGRRPLAWFVLGLIANLPAYALLLALPKREFRAPAGIPPGLGKIASTYSPQPCPRCGAENHPSAPECSNCGAKLSPTVLSEAARVGLRSA
ncbi:MAG: zinc ribbon domain-containing protein [Acidobacteriia bacterium]|nr:zinc ribbon domain-containing protein [Terriglobia bacterium]